MPAAKPVLREECVRLRVSQRLSIRDIQRITGASRGSISLWLRPYPLSEDEVDRRRIPPPRRLRKDRGSPSELYNVASTYDHSSSRRGKIAEAAVMLRLLVRGYDVYGSQFDGDTFDWVVSTPSGSLVKLQVKNVSEAAEHGLPMVSLRRKQCSERYQKGSFDFLVGFDLFTDTCYVWSYEETEHLATTVTIAEHAAERWDKLP
jgi:hypothetical protein